MVLPMVYGIPNMYNENCISFHTHVSIDTLMYCSIHNMYYQVAERFVILLLELLDLVPVPSLEKLLLFKLLL